ncbi:short chain dehydrogenase [Phlyctema vagabunda]|uniref:Short chain dehydrogenase n=1 Tax=Phlyctema vagabunda TaxID=108571 RepID=A0ABR4P8W1_9HELO
MAQKTSREMSSSDATRCDLRLGVHQKTVLITGCSEGGIGEALAKAFHRKGLRVLATGRTLAKIEHLKSLGIVTLPLDVVDSASIEKGVEVVKAAGGTLDILVNNSGAGYSGPLLDTNVEQAKQMFDVNVFAPVAVTQAFAPLLMASKGTVVNIGSISGNFPFFWNGYYNASKAALNMLTDQLRLELAPFDINVILVVTGAVKTRFLQNQPPVTLPNDSYYAAAREEIEFAAEGGVVKSMAVDVDRYAEKVVRNALKKNPSTRQHAGGGATLMWLVFVLIWHRISEMGISRKWGVPKVARKIKLAQSQA